MKDLQEIICLSVIVEMNTPYPLGDAENKFHRKVVVLLFTSKQEIARY